MHNMNTGLIDRVLRVAIGGALLVWFFAIPDANGPWHHAKLIGIVPLATGLIGTCPLYTLLGIRTGPAR